MGTITKRGELQWQAKVRRRGFPAQSRTFSYKEDAERWVRAMERELETTGFIDRREAERNTLADILLRYEKEVTPQKKSAVMESTKIKLLLRDAALTQIKTSALSSSIVAAWRDRRLKQVSGATVRSTFCRRRSTTRGVSGAFISKTPSPWCGDRRRPKPGTGASRMKRWCTCSPL